MFDISKANIKQKETPARPADIRIMPFAIYFRDVRKTKETTGWLPHHSCAISALLATDQRRSSSAVSSAVRLLPLNVADLPANQTAGRAGLTIATQTPLPSWEGGAYDLTNRSDASQMKPA